MKYEYANSKISFKELYYSHLRDTAFQCGHEEDNVLMLRWITNHVQTHLVYLNDTHKIYIQ